MANRLIFWGHCILPMKATTSCHGLHWLYTGFDKWRHSIPKHVISKFTTKDDKTYLRVEKKPLNGQLIDKELSFNKEFQSFSL